MTDEEKRRDPLAHWTKNAEGNIETFPMISYEPRPVAGMAGILRIVYIRAPEMIDRPDSLQLAMTPVQLVQLGQDLLQMGSRLMEAPKPGSSSH